DMARWVRYPGPRVMRAMIRVNGAKGCRMGAGGVRDVAIGSVGAGGCCTLKGRRHERTELDAKCGACYELTALSVFRTGWSAWRSGGFRFAQHGRLKGERCERRAGVCPSVQRVDGGCPTSRPGVT